MTDCWLYAGSLNSYGYGVIFHEGKQLKAHRVMYESVKGEIPEGLYTDHLCRVRSCINPDHIEPVDNVTNIMRGVAPSAQNARKTHCSEGHPFSQDNTLVRKNGWRICRTCKRAWEKRYKKARRLRV